MRVARQGFMRLRARVIAAFSALDGVVAASETVHGWVAGEPARQMALASYNLPPTPTIVEIGVFMGRSTVLLAGARRLRGSGTVHSVDPFDCSGDAHSIPHYVAELRAANQYSLEAAFRANLSRLDLEPWVQVHKGTGHEIASQWIEPIDMLLLDGDHSPEGAEEAFNAWTPFLRKGGILILPNTGERNYAPGHDGNRRLSVSRVHAPDYRNVRQVEFITIAEKAV